MKHPDELRLERELELIQKLSEDEKLKLRVKRLVTRLHHLTLFPDVRFFGDLPHFLGYSSAKDYCDDVIALYLYVGATLALDPEEGKEEQSP